MNRPRLNGTLDELLSSADALEVARSTFDLVALAVPVVNAMKTGQQPDESIVGDLVASLDADLEAPDVITALAGMAASLLVTVCGDAAAASAHLQAMKARAGL